MPLGHKVSDEVAEGHGSVAMQDRHGVEARFRRLHLQLVGMSGVMLQPRVLALVQEGGAVFHVDPAERLRAEKPAWTVLRLVPETRNRRKTQQVSQMYSL